MKWNCQLFHHGIFYKSANLLLHKTSNMLEPANKQRKSCYSQIHDCLDFMLTRTQILQTIMRKFLGQKYKQYFLLEIFEYSHHVSAVSKILFHQRRSINLYLWQQGDKIPGSPCGGGDIRALVTWPATQTGTCSDTIMQTIICPTLQGISEESCTGCPNRLSWAFCSLFAPFLYMHSLCKTGASVSSIQQRQLFALASHTF